MKSKTQWVKSWFGVFELRPGRTAILHMFGNRINYGQDGHSYTVADIRTWIAEGYDCRSVTQREALRLIAKQKAPTYLTHQR